MADIVFKYQEMRNAAEEIRNIGGRYKNAATTFDSDFATAITGWEGQSKDKMQQYISGAVMEYTRDSVPALLDSLAALLEANADQMEQADKQIADSIPSSTAQQ